MTGREKRELKGVAFYCGFIFLPNEKKATKNPAG